MDNKYYFHVQKGLAVGCYDSGFIMENGFRKFNFSSQLKNLGNGFIIEMNNSPSPDSMGYVDLDESIFDEFILLESSLRFVEHRGSIRRNPPVESIKFQSRDTLIKHLGDTLKSITLVLELNAGYSHYILRYDPEAYCLAGDMKVTTGHKRLRVNRYDKYIPMKLSQRDSGLRYSHY